MLGDSGNNAVKEIPAGSNTPIVIGSGFNSPYGVAVDVSGNIYVDDYGNNAVKEVPAGSTTPISIGSRFSNPEGVAADGVGNVYVADNGNNAIEWIKPIGGYYINTLLPAGLSFNNKTGIISGTPTAAGGSPATNYSITAYNSFGSSATTVNIAVVVRLPAFSYSSPQIYSQGTAITPLTPASSYVAASGYSSTPVSFSGGGAAMAFDRAGNMYVLDNTQVEKIPAGSTTPVVIGSGFLAPSFLAVDAAGNVYVTSQVGGGINRVFEIPVGSGTSMKIGSFTIPLGLAVDAAGDLFVADYGAGAVYKIPAGNGTQVKICSGVLPYGIAVDAAGDVFIADYGNMAVKKLPAGSSTPVVIASGFKPYGIAVDASGNVFVSNFEEAVEEIPVGSTTPRNLYSGFVATNVATDGAGNVYVNNLNGVYQFKPVGGYYIWPFLPAGLAFNNTTGVLSGTPTAPSPATNYTVTAYNSFGSSTSTVNISVNSVLPAISYSSPQTYSERAETVSLPPASSRVAALAYNSTPATLGSGFNGPTGVAVDTSGNLYVADFSNKQVKEIPAGSNIPVGIGSGFTNPYGVAVDAAGDVYVADYGANAVYKIPAGNGAPVAVGSGFSHPTGVAVDAAGNVYVADYANSAVKKIPVGSNTPVELLGPGYLNAPIGIAVDGQGDVYIADKYLNAVRYILAEGGTTSLLAPSFSSPVGIAVDASGNLFIGDSGSGSVKEIAVGSRTAVVVSSSFNTPYGVAVDGAGNIYVADHGNNAVKQIKPVGGYFIGPFLPAGLSFNNNTGVISGDPLASSPATNYTVTAYNSVGSGTATVNIKVTSEDVLLGNLVLSSGPLTPAFNPLQTTYTASVASTVSSVTVTPTVEVSGPTITVNGTAVTSATASASLPLAVGANTITVMVTTQDGIGNITYTLTVTRASGLVRDDAFQPLGVVNTTNSITLQDDGIVVHQGVSPNGDGVNDFLQIDNITNYPDNKLTIMNRNGQLIFEARGYDNSSKVFDGHSNKTGQMQLPGTYFYQLAYAVKGIIKYKTGFIVLRY